MLTKTERDFLQNPSNYNDHYARNLRMRINKKIAKAKADLELLLEKNSPELKINIKILADIIKMEYQIQVDTETSQDFETDEYTQYEHW